MGYVGPVFDTVQVNNHPSDAQFPAQVTEFIHSEIQLGGIVGPFKAPPFEEWCHVSPMMTRPKSDPQNHRIITDVTFPRWHSVNTFIRKIQ